MKEETTNPCCTVPTKRLLWEEEINRPDRTCLAWVTIWQKRDLNHPHCNPRFVVTLDDKTIEHQGPASWISDITESPFGQFMLNSWMAANPDKLAILPKSHEEWMAEHYLSAFEENLA